MTTTQHKTRADQMGYTLTEVLVALTVTALISVFLFSGLQWGGRALQIADQTQETSRLDATHNLLRRLLESAELKFEIGADGQREPTFVGEQNTLTFIGPAPAQVETPGLYRLRLSVESYEDGRALFLRRVLYRANREDDTPDPFENTEPYLLVADIEGLSIAYFGALEETDEPEWFDEWNSGRSLPQLIRIDLELSASDPRMWPSLVVAPQLQR
jgi:general secretion pathway protein J